MLVVAAGGGWSSFNRKFDELGRYAALHPDAAGLADWDAYRWILANTKPNDTFVTPLDAAGEDPAAFAVYAAGRKLVAAPPVFSNPYVLWEPREAQRQQIVQAVTGEANSTPLCQYKDGTLWVLLPVGAAADEGLLEAVHSTKHHTIYRVRRDQCA